MSEETVVTAQVTEVKPVEVKTEPDLITKVSSFKPQVTSNATDIILDQKAIDAITDPKLKDAAVNLHKSLQADYTRKTQAVAESRKAVETQLAEMQNWTPEKVQKYLLNNPTFLQSAQAVAGATTAPAATNDSLLTEAEQAKLSLLETKLKELEQERFRSQVSQTDTHLQTRYADYNPSEIEEGLARLSKMSPTEIREYVYKALKHDAHIENAYRVREQELKQLNEQRISSVSADQTQAVNNDGVPVKQKNESDLAFITRLGQFRLGQFSKK